MHLLAKTSAAALVAAAAVVAPASAQQGVPIATEQRAFTVSSHGATVAWSSYDAASDRFRVMARQDGQVNPLPVAPSARAFDIDLGTSRGGGLLAVYTRDDLDGSGDLYRFDFRSGREERLARLSSRTADESHPTVNAGSVAFVRRQGSRDVLRIGNPARAGVATRALASAPARGRAAGIADPQLHGGRIAYVAQDRRGNAFGAKSVRLRAIRRAGGNRVVYEARSGGANDASVTRPSFSADGRELYWARTNQGSGAGNRYVRYTIADRELAYERATSSLISTSFGDDEAGVYGVLGSFDATDVSRLIATGALAFDDRP